VAYEAELGNISIAVVGDVMMNRRLQGFREPEFLKMVDVLRASDVAIANLETQIHQFEMSWAQKPESISWQVGSPECLDDLRWMGFDAVTTASNHSYDYNEAGFLATMENVKAHGLAFAGGGSNLDAARAPVLLDRPRGRVALMGATTTFSDQSQAGLARPDFPGKPGINALHHNRVHLVPKQTFESLREAKRELWYKEYEHVHAEFHPHRAHSYDQDAEVRVFGQVFRLAEGYDIETSCNEDDLAGIEKWLRGAGKQADWRVYGVHCHESGNTGPIHEAARETPPEFLVEFGHWAIDHGCDLVATHGPHILRGIEIYRGKPIFYSLGNFVFNNDTVQGQPEPAYRRQGLSSDHTPGDWGAKRSGDGAYGFPVDPAFFQSVIAVCNYANHSLADVELYPLELGFGRPMSQRGRPMMADEAVADEILAWLQRVSEPFGTKITNEGGVGHIRSSLSSPG
jgi:poly-gamma-glutamate capsule biosynthesis protein CapA/YwtB (metallophosphatase superfamily)